MPLHDWSELSGWEGVHLLWMGELQRYLKERLPLGYRSYLGSGPALAIGGPPARPDVSVRSHPSHEDHPPRGPSEGMFVPEPDIETAVALLDAGPTLFVEREGRLVAAVELVSPRNKDRPAARDAYQSRYAGYLIGGAHLLLVDVHRKPIGFSFADAIAAEFQIPNQPVLSTPMGVAYRVGNPAATGGRLLAIWRGAMSVGGVLPVLPLPLSVELSVPVDLQATYARATAAAYLE